MSAIGPGDWVECINEGRPRCERGLGHRQPVGLVKGAIYQVSRVGIDPADGEGIVRLVGVEANTKTGWFCIHRFRPIYRPKQSLIDTLKRPAPVDLVED